MPHMVTFDAITGKPAPQGDLALGVRGPLSLVQQDGQTFYQGPGGQLLGPLGGEGVFKPQDIDTKGSVIVGDNHFTTGGGGDSLTGEARPMNIWTNGGASTFEDRLIYQADEDLNDGAYKVMENIDWTAGSGGPGSSYLTAKIGCNAGPGDSTFMTETFDLGSENRVIGELMPPPEMHSFGASPNPVLELGCNAGPAGSTFMTGKVNENSGQMISPLSGGDGCAF